MSKNAFNDLWAILNNLGSYVTSRLPSAYIEFVKNAMDPSEESDIDPGIPLEQQEVSPETKVLLGSLQLTYWAHDQDDRRRLAERMHRNEQIYQGIEPSEMTEEEYQEFLSSFDEWNELFGPIPFWEESRGWQPRTIYEIVSDTKGASLTVDDIILKKVYVSPEIRNRILKEAQEWVVRADGREEEELYWHDNDTSSWTYTKDNEDFYKRNVVIKDGHFCGTVIETVHSSGMGMAYYHDEKYGLLFTDGKTAGRTDDYRSRSSDETSHEEEIVYSLKRKE